MTETEREMIRTLTETTQAPAEKFTSLQPTYEDSVVPETEDWDHEDWDHED